MMSFFTALGLYYFTLPYFVWSGPLASYNFVILLSGICGIICFANRESSDRFKSLIFIYFVALLLFYVIINERSFYINLRYLFVLFIPLINSSFQKTTYEYFINIYVAIISISLGVYVLALTGIISPIKTIPPLNELKSINYNVYPFLVSPSGAPVRRFFGPFDEPGVVGTISGIFLCIEKISFKNKRSLILLISGLVSLSFFFYILIGVYFSLYYLERRRIRNLVLFLIAALSVSFYISSSDELQDFAERFEWNTEDNRFAGDNRTSIDLVKFYINANTDTKNILFGVDDKMAYLDQSEGTSSFWNVIILYGLLFFIPYLLFFIIYGNHYKRNLVAFILFLLVLVGTIYQRPYIFQEWTVFLFLMLAGHDSIAAKNGLETFNNKTSKTLFR